MGGQTLFVVTVLAVFCVSLINSVSITKCKSDDSKCMKESAQELIPSFADGLSEYKVKTLDPLHFDEIDASTSTLKLILSDITITGLKKCTAKEIKRDKPKNKIMVILQCPAQLEGQYDMKGKLLLLPIEGKGPIHVNIKLIEINLDVDMHEEEKNGAMYWKVKSWKYSYDLKKKSDVDFENLFEGNDVLAQAAREMISNNGNEIIMEVGDSTIKSSVTSVIKEIINFFNTVPTKDFSLD